MRALILTASAALFISACGRNDNTEVSDDLNALSINEAVVDQNGSMSSAGGIDDNSDTNAATENIIMNDLTTNTPDTNLANGL